MSPSRRISHWAGLPLERPLVMGILNVTPDSFSDGGLRTDSRDAIAAGLAMAAAALLATSSQFLVTAMTPYAMTAHLACALAGLGLVHTLDFMVRPAIERGELVVLLPEYRPKPLEVFIVYPPSRQLSTKVRVFIEWVTQVYGRLGPP